MWFRLLITLALTLATASASDPVPAVDSALRSGLVALQRNDLAGARRDLQTASRLDPENAVVWVALAQTYLRSQDGPAAGDAAVRAGKLGADNPVVEHALAMFYSESGDYARAADWERRFASSPSADPKAAGRAAQLSFQAGDPRDAITWAKLDLAHSDTAEMHHLLGLAYADINELLDSVGQLRAASEAAPANEQFAFDFGRMQLRSGDFAGAMTTFGTAAQRFPNSAQIQLARGVAAYAQRRFTAAIDAFIVVTHLDPAVQQPYEFLGRMLDQAGDRMPQILAVYSAWTTAAAGNHVAWCLYAKALAASGAASAQIEADLRRSLQLNDNYWESHFQLGVLCAKNRRWQEAAAELSRSIELNPQRPEAHFQLARVYDRLGKPELARAERAEHERLTASDTGNSPVRDMPLR